MVFVVFFVHESSLQQQTHGGVVKNALTAVEESNGSWSGDTKLHLFYEILLFPKAHTLKIILFQKDTDVSGLGGKSWRLLHWRIMRFAGY